MMYIIRTPNFVQSMFPGFLWKGDISKPVIHLTFDDGPIPEVTPWVLNELGQYDAKATFFCVGENVTKYHSIMKQAVQEGHCLGNHTYNHLSGWRTENAVYFNNVRKCGHVVDSDLFRPPYGRMRPRQAQFLMRHYKVVMWDVLSADFDSNISPQQCLDNVLSNTGNGSVVVMHDSLKSWKNLEYTLPRVLEHFSEKGFRFENLSGYSSRHFEKLKKTA